MKFLKTYKIAITPLSPIHIGCGEDFEPTNYVIDAEKKLLYGFDPSQAMLDESQAKKLSELGERGNLLGIQRFFRDNKARFIPHSRVLMPVADGVAQDYESGIGRVANQEAGGNQVFNQFTIERHVHSRNTPYIPGSGLKGALRTAMMDASNQRQAITDRDEKRNSGRLAKRLLGGDFSTSPLRLLKVSDCLPEIAIDREVLYAVNRYKTSRRDDKNPRGVTARKESILPGQYRVLTGDITIHDVADKGTPDRNVPSKNSHPNLPRIAKECNAYHMPRLTEELTAMEQAGLIDVEWNNGLKRLLNGEFKSLLEQGSAMLVCLGKYGGAESKTLSDVAEIKIMGAKGQPPKYLPHTTTWWFAAQSADMHSDLLPFGWVLVEIAPQGELPQLKEWCQKLSQNRPDIQTAYASLAEERRWEQEEIAALRQKRIAEAEAKRVQEEARLRREEELRLFPWRARIDDLQNAHDWGALVQVIGKLEADWLAQPEIAATIKTAAEKIRENFPNTWK